MTRIGPHQQLCIAMCCDFFYPRLGGVEMHLWSLAQCLLRRGHKVIILTHAVQDSRKKGSQSTTRPTQRSGIRYMTHGLKVYYLPITPLIDNVTYPTFLTHVALFRTICLRERVQIVHGHQATSAFMHECLFQAKCLDLGLKTVYTDHSLFGLADAASVHLNKLMKFSLSTVDAAISVSHTCRENLVLRASLCPHHVATIPNAVDATKFTPPRATRRDVTDPITVVIISRLVYRKGIDLVARAIPLVCAQDTRVQFLIGGDGAKRLLLEEMRENYRLHDRVTLYGAVPHTQVRDVLCRGHIFLNSSLTESFCIAILEAAACGLFVVSTRVGGVPEVLPPDMVQFAADMTPEALARAVLDAVPRLAGVNRQEFHDRIAKMYNWDAVALRTEKIYEKVCALPDSTLLHRLQLYHGIGPVAGMFASVIVAVVFLFVVFLEWWQPAADIERAVDWRPVSRQGDGDTAASTNDKDTHT